MGRKKTRKRSGGRNRSANEKIITLGEHSSIPQRYRKKKVEIVPRSENQETYLFAIEDYSIIFGVGPAGTGKTLLATISAIRALKAGEIERIIITRPAVTTGEEHGFLPGTLVEKLAPWVRPIIDVFEQYYTPRQIEHMIKDGVIEIAPLAYMRGRNFSDSFILADEMQNATPSQMKMLLTRISSGSKLVITGDLDQHDRVAEVNGLQDFINKIKKYNSDQIKIIQFERGDIERHPIIEEILDIYS